MKKLAVIAPTFNEAENIENFLTAVLAQQKNIPDYELNIVISDSHSKDKTPEIVKNYSKNHKTVYLVDGTPGPGRLGSGLTSGLDYAANKLTADVLVTMEADLSNDPKQLPEFIKKLKANDLVIGSRYSPGGVITNWSWWRKAFSLSANLILRGLAMTSKIHEFTNLYRAFKSEVWLDLKPKISMHIGWLFVPAFAFEAIGSNFKITEQPITYFDRFGGRSKMNTLSYTKNLLHYALRYRLHKSVSFFKFCVVGGTGFLINTTVLVIGVRFGMVPANAGALGAEFAIISNFILNNLWTFSDRKFTSWNEIPKKFITFNVLSFGSAIIQYIFLKVGELIFGLTAYKGPIIDVPYIRLLSWYMIFYVAGVAVGLVWNYIMYSKVIWRKKPGSV